MAFIKREKAPEFVTPVGTFKYPKLNAPDHGTKEYPDADGSYKVNMVFDKTDPEVQAFLAKLTTLHATAVANARAEFAELKLDSRKRLEKENGEGGIKVMDFIKPIYDEATEEETNQIELRFKMKASGKRKDDSKWTARPKLFDGVNNVFPRQHNIWGGTTGRVSFAAGSYFIPGTGIAGISLKLKAAKVITLVSEGMATAESCGFGDDDGGFDASSLSDETQDEGMGAPTEGACAPGEDPPAHTDADLGNF